MNKAGKPLISFDVKNGQYAIGDSTPKPLNYLAAFAKEKSLGTKEIYGDGQLQVTVYSDNGYTGTLTMTSADPDYNIDLKIAVKLNGGGVGAVTQHYGVEHNLYFETYDLIKLEDGTEFKKTTGKVWVFGVTASAPGETLNQTTNTINENGADYGLIIKGTPLMNSTGSGEYVDENGLTYKVFTYKKLPGDEGYADFEKTVPVPKKSTM